MAAHVQFQVRHKPVPAPSQPGSNRVGKQHRPFGEPVAFLKSTPQFEAVPGDAPKGSLVMALSAIAPEVSDAITKEKKALSRNSTEGHSTRLS